MELSNQTLQGLCDVIRRLCGLVLGPHKAYLIRHRLAPLVQSEGLTSFEQLLERLHGRSAGRLHDAIVEAITTKETSFFRDRAFFDALQTTVLPECMRTLRRFPGQRHRIRIWSAGCATGQEAVSVAILIRELYGADGQDAAFAVLGTDLSALALSRAQEGRYSAADVKRGLSEDRLARHFRRCGSDWVVVEPLRRLLSFRRFDLLQPPTALGAFDVILCRNVLIYFDEPTRQRLCASLCDLLQAGGWLALGSAESLSGVHRRVETVRVGRVQLYRRNQPGG
ncbi:MAG: protein-glutamate O-methyltransferase CheR [Planctomycetota bacterium]